MKVQIRWLIRRDMQEVLEIEKACFEFVWTEEDFLCCLRQRNCIGMVSESDHNIVGFIIYELHKKQLKIMNLAVHPTYRRRGVGAEMVRRLQEKIRQQRRTEILLEVRESNLAAQLFFQSQGFVAINILTKHFVTKWYPTFEESSETAEDAYVMRYEIPLDDLLPENREILIEE